MSARNVTLLKAEAVDAIQAHVTEQTMAIVHAELDDHFTVLHETDLGLSVTIGNVYSPAEITSPYPSVTFILP